MTSINQEQPPTEIPANPAPTASAVVIPFLQELGVEVLDAADGVARIALVLQKGHLNSWGAGHGGIIMTLLDAVMSAAGRSLDTEARAGVTVEMKASFLQPAGTCGSRLIATGKVFHRSTTMCFCEGEIHDGDKLVAKAMGTFKYLKRRRPSELPTAAT